MKLKRGLGARLWVMWFMLVPGCVAAPASDFWGPRAIGKNFDAPLEVVFKEAEQVLIENGEQISGATPDWQIITTEPRLVPEKNQFFGKNEEYRITIRFRHAEEEIRVTALCMRTKRGKILGLFKRNRQVDSDGLYESYLLTQLMRKVYAWQQQNTQPQSQVAPAPVNNVAPGGYAPPVRPAGSQSAPGAYAPAGAVPQEWPSAGGVQR